MSLAVISDVHGKFGQYVNVARKYEHTLQLGDMGFDYDKLNECCILEGLASDKHKFFGGNHDNYDTYHEQPNSLGDFGPEELGGREFFYVRGAFSIDREYRLNRLKTTGLISWWEEEQLSNTDMFDCSNNYGLIKPDTVITHTCPDEIAAIIGNPDILVRYGHDPKTHTTHTQQILQAMFDVHKPKLWIFGHFHKSVDFEHKGTRFICLSELEAIEI